LVARRNKKVVVPQQNKFSCLKSIFVATPIQANWERELKQRRASTAGPATPDGEASSIESILSCAPKPSLANLISTPILRSGSCTRWPLHTNLHFGGKVFVF
jgi:hypothetical protein